MVRHVWEHMCRVRVSAARVRGNVKVEFRLKVRVNVRAMLLLGARAGARGTREAAHTFSFSAAISASPQRFSNLAFRGSSVWHQGTGCRVREQGTRYRDQCLASGFRDRFHI